MPQKGERQYQVPDRFRQMAVFVIVVPTPEEDRHDDRQYHDSAWHALIMQCGKGTIGHSGHISSVGALRMLDSLS